MTGKYSITHKKVAVWHYPVIARALEDIHNDCEGVYPVFNEDSCLTHVEISLDMMFGGRTMPKLQAIPFGVLAYVDGDKSSTTVSDAQIKIFELLKDTEADPEHTQALKEVLSEVMFNDSLEILA